MSPPIPFTLDNLQHDFDVLSWQTFVALNWPANADGSANTSAKIGAPGKTVGVVERKLRDFPAQGAEARRLGPAGARARGL